MCFTEKKKEKRKKEKENSSLMTKWRTVSMVWILMQMINDKTWTWACVSVCVIHLIRVIRVTDDFPWVQFFSRPRTCNLHFSLGLDFAVHQRLFGCCDTGQLSWTLCSFDFSQYLLSDTWQMEKSDLTSSDATLSTCEDSPLFVVFTRCLGILKLKGGG